jgi:hypothetical protein
LIDKAVELLGSKDRAEAVLEFRPNTRDGIGAIQKPPEKIFLFTEFEQIRAGGLHEVGRFRGCRVTFRGAQNTDAAIRGGIVTSGRCGFLLAPIKGHRLSGINEFY